MSGDARVRLPTRTSLRRQGSLAQLDTKTPVMYVDFPAGRLKLFGTLCFPKAKYLALRFGPREVLCEDVFENMVRLFLLHLLLLLLLLLLLFLPLVRLTVRRAVSRR